ncbi:MAG: DUF3090 family protein [Anaerolineae bacterium]|nr:DUF3090 family protein [Anaerolineae bacterium]
MPQSTIELDPVDFVTVGAVGPKGRRVFHLQAGKGGQLVTVIIEKQQAQALSEAIAEMLSDLENKSPGGSANPGSPLRWDMSLRKPVEPLFRAAQMGLGYDEERDLIVLVAQELVVDEDDMPAPDPQTIRLWGTRQQLRALSEHAQSIVQQGRPDPRSNGFMIYYWT